MDLAELERSHWGGLTPAQRRLVESYFHSHDAFNDPANSLHDSRRVEEFDRIVRSRSLPHDTTLYRGLPRHGLAAWTGVSRPHKLSGGTFSTGGRFTSAGFSLGDTEGYGDLKLKIHVPGGTPGMLLNSRQREFVFPRGVEMTFGGYDSESRVLEARVNPAGEDFSGGDSRSARVARLILASLEGYQVAEPISFEQFTRFYPGEKDWEGRAELRKRQYDKYLAGDLENHPGPGHLQVARKPGVRRRLEKWLTLPHVRDVRVRIFVGNPEGTLESLKQPGVLTFVYGVATQSMPPTAWVVIHNLSHALFDDDEHLMLQLAPKFGHREGIDPHTPTTKSQALGKVRDRVEAFHEVFAQWVSSGRVVLNPRNPELETWMAEKFSADLHRAAAEGKVIFSSE